MQGEAATRARARDRRAHRSGAPSSRRRSSGANATDPRRPASATRRSSRGRSRPTSGSSPRTRQRIGHGSGRSPRSPLRRDGSPRPPSAIRPRTSARRLRGGGSGASPARADGDARDHGDPLAALAVMEEVRATARGPGLLHARDQEEAGFVDEDEVGTQPRDVSLMPGQICFFQRSIRSSPRSSACRSGFLNEGSTCRSEGHGVRIDFSRPGKPTDNCFIETFNRSLRDECLNVDWFETLEDARAKIEAWRRNYNESRPHQALNELAPAEFAARIRDLETGTEPQHAENQPWIWSEKPKRLRSVRRARRSGRTAVSRGGGVPRCDAPPRRGSSPRVMTPVVSQRRGPRYCRSCPEALTVRERFLERERAHAPATPRPERTSSRVPGSGTCVIVTDRPVAS